MEKIPGLLPIIDEKHSKTISEAIESLAQENAKFANQRNSTLISSKENIVKQTFKSSIETFLKSDANKTVFDMIFEIPSIHEVQKKVVQPNVSEFLEDKDM